MTLERRQECIYDEKEKEKNFRNGRLDMVIWQLRPFYWRGLREGLRFTILSHIQLVDNVVKPSRRINAVGRDSSLLFVCVECTSEALRGVQWNKELQRGQSLNCEPHVVHQSSAKDLLATSPNPIKSSCNRQEREKNSTSPYLHVPHSSQ